MPVGKTGEAFYALHALGAKIEGTDFFPCFRFLFSCHDSMAFKQPAHCGGPDGPNPGPTDEQGQFAGEASALEKHLCNVAHKKLGESITRYKARSKRGDHQASGQPLLTRQLRLYP